MKKILLILIAIVFATSSFAASNDNDTTVCFTVNPPMHCVNCENKIKSNLRYEKGIKQIEASAQDALVTVKFDKRKTSVAKLIDGFKKIGYEATPAEAKQAPKKCSHNCGSCGGCKK